MKASRVCPFCRLAMDGQRCGFCGGAGYVEIEFANSWHALKWHLYRRLPALRLVLGVVRFRVPGSSPEGT